MKIAICIYGVHSDYRCVDFINLMSKKYQTSVFVHYWNFNKLCYKRKLPFDKKNFTIQNVDLHTKSTLYENVLDELKQKQSLFADKNNCIPDLGFLSLLYGLYKSNELKNTVEQTNAYPYDCVFCMTYGTYVDKIIDLKQFDLQVINTTYSCESPVNPNFVFGNSKNISNFCSLYSNVHQIDKQMAQDMWIKKHMEKEKFSRFWFQSDIGDN